MLASLPADRALGSVLRIRSRLLVIVVLCALVVVAALAAARRDDGGGSAQPTPGASGAPASPGGPTGATSATSATSALPTTSVPAAWQTQFLACVAQRESGDAYTAIGPGGAAFGAYQMTPQSWNETVQHYGWTSLAGVRPDQASPAAQDQVAMGLLQWQEAAPWGGGCQSN